MDVMLNRIDHALSRTRTCGDVGLAYWSAVLGVPAQDPRPRSFDSMGGSGLESDPTRAPISPPFLLHRNK